MHAGSPKYHGTQRYTRQNIHRQVSNARLDHAARWEREVGCELTTQTNHPDKHEALDRPTDRQTDRQTDRVSNVTAKLYSIVEAITMTSRPTDRRPAS